MHRFTHILPGICLVLFATLFDSAHAQSFDFLCLGQGDGLPADGVFDLIEEENGALLIATEGGGLARYNGEQLTHWDHTSVLGADTIRCLTRGAEGVTWIGTDGHGLFHFHNDTFTAVAPQLANAEIRSLAEDATGRLWIATMHEGLFSLDQDSLTKHEFPADTFRALLVSSDSSLYVGSDEGLFKQHGKEFELLEASFTEALSSKILTLFEDNQGRIWAGTQQGAVGLKGDSASVIPPEIARKRIKTISQDQQGNLWFGTRSGAYEWDEAKELFTRYTSSNGLSNDRIRKLYADRSGTLWFGTYFGGVCQLQDQLNARYSRDHGFPESAITSMAITPDSSLWFGTYEGDVFSLSFQGELRQVHASNDEDVNAIVAAGDSLLVFTSGQGLSLIVDPSAKELQPQLGMEYRYIATDHIIFRETPYLLSSNVLFQINQELSSDDFACETLTDFEIVDSTLYVGSSCGLFTLSIDNKGKWILPTNRMDFKPVKGSELLEIASIKADDAGNIWIGSSKNGLYRYDGSVRKYANRNLADPRIIDIDIDNDQNIWVATRSGVSFLELDPSQEIVLNSTHFGVAEGIDSQINHIKCGVDHQIWLGSSNGLISLNPDGAFHNNASPALSLDGLRLNYNPIDWEALGYQVSSLPTNPVFEHNQNHLTFDFHAIDLSGPRSVIYQCLLEGFDIEWVDLNNVTTHTYPQLPPGEYRFSVRSRNSSGIWNTTPMSYAFSISRPIYQEPWFLTTCALALILLVYSFFQYRLSRLKKAKVVLEQKVQERTVELNEEKEKSERLLLNILPKETADELKEKGYADTRNYDNASVLFSDFKGFTNLTEQMNSDDLVRMLDSAFKAFDRNCDRFGVEKIKTIGDAYMCATGIPNEDHDHATKMVSFAREMIAVMNELNKDNLANGLPAWDIRIGIHSGPLIAGVVGEKKFAYDIWGDTVNLASRMESSGEAGRINLSESTYELIKQAHKCTPRGKIQAKNKGELEMYFLEE